ncbi:hypothetical protein F3J16_30300 [Burkholderia sp. Ap-962]|uniref:hypothetical protein n=1 Tax=Burkholderia sp. Ap-962 TaxID=2608333 RepID=UPI00141E13E5|nr:hypothetical protein [Burkholderia sp. Ap-962]NIF74435.1 hypothetical protein [Burkholderia sp. Ap-962]
MVDDPLLEWIEGRVDGRPTIRMPWHRGNQGIPDWFSGFAAGRAAGFLVDAGPAGLSRARHAASEMRPFQSPGP